MRIWVQKVHFFKSFLKKPSKAKQWIKLKTKMWKGRVQFTERKKEAVSWYYWNPFECFSPFTYIYPFFLCSKIMYVAILNPLGGNRFRNFIWQLKLWQKNTKSISFHFQFSIRYRCIYRWQPLAFTYSKSNYSKILDVFLPGLVMWTSFYFDTVWKLSTLFFCHSNFTWIQSWLIWGLKLCHLTWIFAFYKY